jgi:hypothetical protein
MRVRDSGRPGRRGHFHVGVDRIRPILVAAALAVGSLVASAAVNSRPVLADHGGVLWGTSGDTGYWNGPLWRCESSQPHIVIYAPDVLAATYVQENGLSQVVYWTPRVWWADPDGTLHHTYVDGSRSDLGWYRAWVRPGDSHGGLIVFPERGSTGGAAGALAWTNESDVTMSLPFTVPYSPENPSGKNFMVEFIFYWASNEVWPNDGWLSQQIDMGDGYGGRHPACGLQ